MRKKFLPYCRSPLTKRFYKNRKKKKKKRQLASEEKRERDTQVYDGEVGWKENKIKKEKEERKRVIKWLNGRVVCRSGNRTGHGSDREKQKP